MFDEVRFGRRGAWRREWVWTPGPGSAASDCTLFSTGRPRAGSVPRMRTRIIAAWWLACLLWSGTFLFIRLGVAAVPPFTFASVRLLTALAVLIPLTALRHGFAGVRRRDAWHVMGAGVLLLGVNYALVYWGAQFIASGLVSILQAGTPMVALALGWVLGSEAITARKIAALAAGLIGIIVIFYAQAGVSGTAAIAGTVAVSGGSVCVAAAYVWLRQCGHRLPALTVTTLQCVSGSLFLGALALVVEGNPLSASWSAPALIAMLYLALGGSVAAFWINCWLIDRMEPSAMLMMGVAEVPIAVALGAAVFDERLPAGAVLGSVCVLAGVVVGPMMAAKAATGKVKADRGN